MASLDWSKCPAVESVPDRRSCAKPRIPQQVATFLRPLAARLRRSEKIYFPTRTEPFVAITRALAGIRTGALPS
jgi:hypothetical protein